MADLPKRKLGRTGLEVTTLGYGAMELRGAPRGAEITDPEAERLLNGVLDAGINFIDTSIDYGRSEERIGRCDGRLTELEIPDPSVSISLTSRPHCQRR